LREYIRKSDFEALLDLLENLLVLVGGDKRDGETLGSETAGTTNTMQVRVGIGRQIVVDRQVDALNIDTAAKDISGDTDALVKLLEFFVPANAMWTSVSQLNNQRLGRQNIPLLLADTGVDSD
jgi:hypothetical protein